MGLETDAEAAQDAAVLIGIEAYPFLPDVPYAKRDVEAFRQYLPKTRGVPDGQVTVGPSLLRRIWTRARNSPALHGSSMSWTTTV